MSENDVTPESKPRRRAAGRPAGPPADASVLKAPAVKAPAVKAPAVKAPAVKAPAVKAPAVKAAEKAAVDKKKAPAAKKPPISVPVFQSAPVDAITPAKKKLPAAKIGDEVISVAAKGQAKKRPAKKSASLEEPQTTEVQDSESLESGDERSSSNNRNRNRNRRGGKSKNRGKSGTRGDDNNDTEADGTNSDENDDESDADTSATRGSGETSESVQTAPPRKRSRTRTRDGSEGESGSTRLDAKRARRRDGRDSGRRRAPILTESEFLARRENVERVMIVRQQGTRTQIAVLEDGIVVEHYINQSSSGSLVGNVYLGRVQNVLPGMEAAFVDIGKGRNAVLYAGEVNWDAAGLDGQPKKIETALKSGDPILVQVTKDPVGQKGARLTSQISLPGRFLVYVPNNPMTGISRKLPDRERSRLKTILKAVVPEDGGVIVRTAAEGASEEELGRDVARLAAQWTDIEAKSKTASPPTMLYGEPDISIKVVRDIFNEDVKKLIVSGAEAWETVEQYVSYVAPDLADRLEKYVGTTDVFTEHQIDEQIAKALDRKVYLPSGGSLVIDRTEAMTVVDVNTGKFIGSGGNLEQTVTKNNLEAAEEIVRQLRLRDIGGIIVIDFIDMVLESNRDQVIRRLVECLGRDRTKHQVAEVTSLGLVQMTRKRIGAGLLEVFSEPCDHCQGRGAVINMAGHDPEKAPKNKPKQGNNDEVVNKPKAPALDALPKESTSV